MNSGSLLKQKSPLANDPTVSKDPTVCAGALIRIECLIYNNAKGLIPTYQAVSCLHEQK